MPVPELLKDSFFLRELCHHFWLLVIRVHDTGAELSQGEIISQEFRDLCKICTAWHTTFNESKCSPVVWRILSSVSWVEVVTAVVRHW